jgi:hypothetical protein
MQSLTFIRRSVLALALAGAVLTVGAQSFARPAAAQFPVILTPGDGGGSVQAWLDPTGRTGVYQLCVESSFGGTAQFLTANRYRNGGRDYNLGVRVPLSRNRPNCQTTVTLERGDLHITPVVDGVYGGPIVLG